MSQKPCFAQNVASVRISLAGYNIDGVTMKLEGTSRVQAISKAIFKGLNSI